MPATVIGPLESGDDGVAELASADGQWTVRTESVRFASCCEQSLSEMLLH